VRLLPHLHVCSPLRGKGGGGEAEVRDRTRHEGRERGRQAGREGREGEREGGKESEMGGREGACCMCACLFAGRQ
jgi:hypothetical protein